MTTILEKAIICAAKTASAIGGVEIVYNRGDEAVEMTAIKGRSQRETTTTEGYRIEYTDLDFIILTQDLILGGKISEPQRGDRIKECYTDELWEVLPFGDAGCFEKCDSSGLRIKIHVKKVQEN